MTPVRVAGIGVLGPGLPGWEASRAILAGDAPWQCGEVVLPAPALLPATERRRAGPVVRLALAVASEAAAASGLPPASLRPVFGSGNGDVVTVGAILDGLTRPDGFVSPTQFHNSVHNAAAGYWSIGAGSNRPATCLGCFDWTFAGALMKAVAECAAEREPVLLCVYDVPMPSPLDAKRVMGSVFGVALVLAPGGSGPRITVEWRSEADPAPLEGGVDARPASQDGGVAPLPPPASGNAGEELRLLARTNPAARALPLLQLLARGEFGSLDAALLDGTLRVTVTP